ncbi:hypothetical protein D3C84_1077070 [compost metagenome]
MSALARSSIANPGRVQVSLEEPIPHHEVIGVGQTAFGVEKDEVQFVLTHRLVVSLDDIDCLRLLAPVQCIDLA